MSHQIEDNMLAYAGATPWHGLGHAVPEGATGEEMLVIAGLNWEVVRRSLAMKVPAKSKGSGPSFLAGPLDGYKAITREDTNQVFQVATNDYFPLQNREIVDFFREYCEAGHAKMETVGALKGGRIVWALAKLNGGSNAMIGAGDEVKGYMLLSTSHDGSIRTIGMPTQVRVVCHNTLSAAVGKYLSMRGEKTKVSQKEAATQGVFLMKHSRKWTPERAAEAQKIMGMAIEQVQATNELCTKLSKVHIDEKGRMEFVVRLLAGESLLQQVMTNTEPGINGASVLEAMMAAEETTDPTKVISRIGKAILEAILDSPGADLPSAKNTLWGAVNGVTYFNDHVRSGDNQNSRLASSWYLGGHMGGNGMKQNAVKVAVQMAGLAA